MQLGVAGVGGHAASALLPSSGSAESGSREQALRSTDAAAVGAASGPLGMSEQARAVSEPEGGAMSELLLDAAGRRRSAAPVPALHAARSPRNKGMRYPADPPATEEIVTVLRRAGDTAHGRRLRGLIVVLWRAGLRICEALAL